MIGRHVDLSCYALEHPYEVYYHKKKDIVELIDINNDIYKFRLPDKEHYDVLMILDRKYRLTGVSSSTLDSRILPFCCIKLTIFSSLRTKNLLTSSKM
jgi:hypothetical protein